jgi:hypothetical protein
MYHPTMPLLILNHVTVQCMHQIYTQINNLKLLIKHVYVSGPPFIFDEDDIVKTLGDVYS